MNESTPIQLTDNEHVKELLSLIRENGRDPKDLTALISSVSVMEQQLFRASESLAAMQKELSVLKDEHDHPVRTLLEKTAQALADNIQALLSSINAMKEEIISGAKRAVDAVKESGINALNNLAGFFNLKSGLLFDRDSIKSSIDAVNRQVAGIEAASARVNAVGQAVSNVGRVIRGQEPVSEAQTGGRLAHILAAPFRAELQYLNRCLRSTNRAIQALDRLERSATRSTEQEKPSTLALMRDLQSQLDATRVDARNLTKEKQRDAVI